MQNRWKVLLVVFMISFSVSACLTGGYQHADIGKSSQFILSGLKRVLFSGTTQLREETPVSEQESIKVEIETQEPEQELEEVKESWLDFWPAIYVFLPREINQATYFQHVENLVVNYDVPPSRIETIVDKYENSYLALYWNETQTSNATVTIEIIISRKVGMTPVNTSDPYPIPQDLLSNINNAYLQPTKRIQSDDPTIVALAQNLSQGFDKQVDVVNNTLEWISENIKWRCYSEAIKEHGKYTDAVSTLKYGGGGCSHFARLMTALFRAQGIPARQATGLKGYEHSNPGYLLRPVNDSITYGWHVWTEVYYPEIGWVRYDATYFPHPPYIPYGIQFGIYPPDEITNYPGVMSFWPKYDSPFKIASANWKITGLEENKVKFTYHINLIPQEQPEG